MLGQPFAHLGMLVGGIIVNDGVNILGTCALTALRKRMNPWWRWRAMLRPIAVLSSRAAHEREGFGMRRRDLITLLGGVAACGARATAGQAAGHRISQFHVGGRIGATHPCIHAQPHCRRTTLILFYLIGATLRGTLGQEGPKLRGGSRDPMAVFWGEAAPMPPRVGS